MQRQFRIRSYLQFLNGWSTNTESEVFFNTFKKRNSQKSVKIDNFDRFRSIYIGTRIWIRSATLSHRYKDYLYQSSVYNRVSIRHVVCAMPAYGEGGEEYRISSKLTPPRQLISPMKKYNKIIIILFFIVKK